MSSGSTYVVEKSIDLGAGTSNLLGGESRSNGERGYENSGKLHGENKVEIYI